MNTISLWRKFAKSKKYRHAFVAAHFKRFLPFQITAMRNKAGWSQEELAEACGLTQGVISRAENPNYGNLTFNTVLRIAAGLDVAFIGEFVPFSELAKRVEKLSEEAAQVATFEEEQYALSRMSTHDKPSEEQKILPQSALTTALPIQATAPKESIEALCRQLRSSCEETFTQFLSWKRLIGTEPTIPQHSYMPLHILKQTLAVPTDMPNTNPSSAGSLKIPVEAYH